MAARLAGELSGCEAQTALALTYGLVAGGAGGPATAPADPEKKKTKYKAKGEAAELRPEQPPLRLEDLLGSTNFARDHPGIQDPKARYYITTAINYANGSPHMGHAYEAMVTDVVARYERLAGKETRFLTGADEHGQKIANEAAKQGLSPMELVDRCVAEFKALDVALDVSYDDYVRTTSERHKARCRELWERCAADVFLERYEGWYDERAEMFVKQSDAEQQNFCDADGVALKRTSEECYFFRLGKYAGAIKAHIEAHPDFVQPEARKAEVLKMLDDSEAVEKLSISRTTFTWGVSLPAGSAPGHVMYVWIDALTNYLTGGLQPGETLADMPDSFWPADSHVIGKDIVRFHAIYWPAFLMSAKLPLPKHVFCHGFVNDDKGTKMSKSLGNVVDPVAMLAKYDADSLRYFCVKEASPGADVKFSEPALVLAHNGELADAFGNLMHRATAFAKSKCDGAVPVWDAAADGALLRPFDLALLRAASRDAIEGPKGHDIGAYAFQVMAACRAANKWLTYYEPWKMKEDRRAERDAVLRLLLEACYALALFLAPLVPRAATRTLRRLGSRPVPTPALLPTFRNLADKTPVTCGAPLFAQLPMPGTTEEAASEDTVAGDQNEKRKKGPPSANDMGAKKGGTNKAAAAEASDYGNDEDTAASQLALVVGRIVDVWPHPDSDKLFCEKIDCGEAFGGVREIGSGLRHFYHQEDLKDRLVLVVANLKAKKLAGFPSHGMVLCASSEDHTKVVCVDPPPGAAPGARVLLPGLPNPPARENQCDKKKFFAKAAPHFRTQGGQCFYKDKPFEVPGKGPVTCQVDDGYQIS